MVFCKFTWCIIHRWVSNRIQIRTCTNNSCTHNNKWWLNLQKMFTTLFYRPSINKAYHDFITNEILMWKSCHSHARHWLIVFGTIEQPDILFSFVTEFWYMYTLTNIQNMINVFWIFSVQHFQNSDESSLYLSHLCKQNVSHANELSSHISL